MRITILLLFTAFVLSSCGNKRFMYATSAVHNPMFKEKGEIYASSYYVSNGNERFEYGAPLATSYKTIKSNGFSLQGGYAFKKKLGITAGVNYTDQRDQAGRFLSTPTDTLSIDYDRFNFYLAGVFFTHNTGGFAGFNLMAGLNAGKMNMTDIGISTANYSYYFEANNISAFLQPSLNFHPTNNFRLGFHMRINYVTHNNIKTNYSTEQLKNYRLFHLSPMFINEVGSKISFGFKALPALLFDSQLAFLYSNTGNVNTRGANISTGITYRWNNKMKK